MRISVVTPSFNQGQFLEETIRSVLDQNYPDLEYIIIDGGSTDNSVNIIRKYSSKLAYWQSTKDRGQSHAINVGFQHATGDIFLWLNSDDLLLPDSLSTISTYFTNHPHCSWLIAESVIIDADGLFLNVRSPIIPSAETMVRWMQGTWFAQQSVFWRKSLWLSVGLLDENLHYVMDWDLWLRFLAHEPPDLLRARLSKYRWHKHAKCLASPGKVAKEECAIFNKIKLAEKDSRLSLYKNPLLNYLLEKYISSEDRYQESINAQAPRKLTNISQFWREFKHKAQSICRL